jgi:tRNA G18 (ribose-2'-O)-methylase SpoU
MRFNAQQLRDLEEKRAIGTIREIKRNPLYFILENIYDTYNTGGLFRLADALAIAKMYLCGDTEIPPNSRIKKASIGTYKVVPWEYKKTAKEAIGELKKMEVRYRSEKQVKKMEIEDGKNSNFQPPPSELASKPNFHFPTSIIAVEQNKKAVSYTKADYKLPLALVFGNETYGILPETLKLVDQIVEIPMFGINKSLNVIVSAAIVSYWAINLITK